jgi:hypothetical protein
MSDITVFPTKIRSRLKSGAQTQIYLKITFTSTIARVDKSARVTAAVEAIRKGKFTDYTKATKYYNYNPISVSKKIQGKTYTRKKTDFF